MGLGRLIKISILTLPALIGLFKNYLPVQFFCFALPTNYLSCGEEALAFRVWGRGWLHAVTEGKIKAFGVLYFSLVFNCVKQYTQNLPRLGTNFFKTNDFCAGFPKLLLPQIF